MTSTIVQAILEEFEEEGEEGQEGSECHWTAEFCS